MLLETRKVGQQRGTDGYRRWFSDEEMDLIVWYDNAGEIEGFELCYEKTGDEHAFTWRRGGKLTHARIDQGEDLPTDNRSPILVAGGPAPRRRVLADFRRRAGQLEHRIALLVIAKLKPPTHRLKR